MKTLVFANVVPDKRGAYEILLSHLARRFREAGDRLVLALAGPPIPAVARELDEAGAVCRVVEGWVSPEGREAPWAFCRPALRLLRTEQPDVAAVHFGNELPTLAACLLGSGWPRRRVRWVWEQDQQISDPGPVARYLSRLRLLSRACDRFVAVYEGGAAAMRSRGIPSARMRVIANAVEDAVVSRPPEASRASIGLPPGTCLLVTVGSLIPRKRIEFLIHALAEAFRRAAGPMHLAIIGAGPEEPALVACVHARGLASNVTFLGRRQDVRDWLSAADVYVHAAVAEACNYTILEAMAAGRPVLTTEAGAAREQVAEGVSGFVTGRDDRAGFADRLVQLVGDPALRERLGQAGRARWADRYRVEKAAAAYHALYAELAGKRRA